MCFLCPASLASIAAGTLQITHGDFYLCPRQRCRLLRVADQDPHPLFSLT
jgi:hypothetical protein